MRKTQRQSNYLSSSSKSSRGKILLYDGSFFGLICALERALNKETCFEDIKPKDLYRVNDLFCDGEFIETDIDKAEDFLIEIRKISPEIERAIVFSYHADIKGYEKHLLDFLRDSLHYQVYPDDFSKLYVRFVQNLVRRVGCELHRFKGFLRFQELTDGSLLALYEPDHNITPLLVKHFKERLGNLVWIIIDLKRNYGIKWNTLDFDVVTDITHLQNIGLSTKELSIQKLWKNYFNEIAIKERLNKRLQMQNMPKKYWKYLVEI